MPVDRVLDTTERSLDQPNRLGAFGFRDFRLLWSGLVVSNTGSWMQYLAQGWLVVELANSASRGALYLGFVGLVRAIPALLLSGIAGTLADRVERRRILVVANLVMGLSAAVLGTLVVAGKTQIWEVMLCAALSSAGSAFDAPTRQSLVPLIVNRATLMNAIGLNSAAFNGPAIIGPALAGILVAAVGLAPCFFLNAASYVAVIVAVLFMAPRPPVPDERRGHFHQDMFVGLHYVWRNGPIFGLLALSTIFAIIVRPYIQLLPSFAKDIVGGGPAALGVLGSAVGAGALGGSISTAFLGLQRLRGAVLLGCGAAAGIALVTLAEMRALAPAALVLALLGLTVMLFMGMANTLLQTYTPIEMRGRIMGLYTMTFLGLMPLGTWLLGTVASAITLPVTFVIAGCVIVAVVAAVAVPASGVRSLH